MKIRTDFVTNSSSSSYCVSFNVKIVDGTEIGLDFWPEDEDGSGEVYIPLKGSVDSLISKIKRCSSVPKLAKLLSNSLDLEEFAEEDEEGISEETLEEFNEAMSNIEDIRDIESVEISEFFTGWGEFARDGISDFLEKVFSENFDYSDMNAVKEFLSEKMSKNEVENLVEQLKEDCISMFNASISTTLNVQSGMIEKTINFDAN